MKVLVALGGNALLRRGEALSNDNQRANVKIAAKEISTIMEKNEVIICHGNGPQVGLLMLQNAAYKAVPGYPLDVLGAESQGMIGYMIEQELSNLVGDKVAISTLLTQVEVDKNDPAFQNPTKPVGPVYDKAEAEELAAARGWTIAPDGDKYRQVVASPRPTGIVNLKSINWLLEKGSTVICAGGGGIPVYRDEQGKLQGIEAVIDKDLCSALLAQKIDVDLFLIATDVEATFVDFGKPTQKAIAKASPNALKDMGFAAGSMGPKVLAATEFAEATGKTAVIGSLNDIVAILEGKAGTHISTKFADIEYY